jgi:hypothetical protein
MVSSNGVEAKVKRDKMQWFPFWLVEDGDISFYNP